MKGLGFIFHSTFAKACLRKTGFDSQIVNVFCKNLNFRAGKSKVRLIWNNTNSK